jgi:hypothetical protein
VLTQCLNASVVDIKFTGEFSQMFPTTDSRSFTRGTRGYAGVPAQYTDINIWAEEFPHLKTNNLGITELFMAKCILY